MKILLINKETTIVEGITYLNNLGDVSSNHIGLEIKENDNFDYMGRKYDVSSKTFSDEIVFKPEIIKQPNVNEQIEDLKRQIATLQEYALTLETKNMTLEVF